MAHNRLFIPGPVEVAPDVLEACATPMVGHRSADFSKLYDEVQQGLRWLLGTEQTVLLFTSSATGVWEACSRNLVGKGCLHLTNGAFSERWEEVTRLNGRPTGKIAAEWGRPNDDLDALKRELDTGRYDAVAVVHSETSTGVLNPLADIAEVVRGYEGVLLLVDAVSSMTTLPIDVEALCVDVLLASVQKGFGLPPGLSVAAISERAFQRAESIEGRGYYFDLLEMRRYHGRSQTPTTPAIPQIYALRCQLERARREGLEARFARHRAMAERVRGWAKEHGLELLAPEGRQTFGLTCIRNTRELDVEAIARTVRERHGAVMDKGYGKIKLKTFRIAHMGDITPLDIEAYLGWLDEAIAEVAG